MVKAVIFDLDDTLIPEKQYIESGYHYIAKILNKRFGIPLEKIFRDLVSLFNENPKYVFNRLFSMYGIDYTAEMIQDLVTAYRSHLPEICFYDDVMPCLEYLKLKSMKLGIITDGYVNAQYQKLKAVNAYDYFNEIIITDEFGEEFRKPNPKAFKEMRDRLEIEFRQMVYVGDNPEKDFYISKIYPIKTMRIIRKNYLYEPVYKNREYLCGIKENYRITNLDELKSLIDDELSMVSS